MKISITPFLIHYIPFIALLAHFCTQIFEPEESAWAKQITFRKSDGQMAGFQVAGLQVGRLAGWPVGRVIGWQGVRVAGWQDGRLAG